MYVESQSFFYNYTICIANFKYVFKLSILDIGARLWAFRGEL